ncbi:LruC domain-containing protein [uncultured Odoribacter sp.]|uniref:LruC domain-containing protein n=1 Tax=uncultured Odoribacter sp. TaxID=876416 RepID=UPI00263889C7|nr:LruC domain-containing protein [uncultured Odoribacter sp.]
MGKKIGIYFLFGFVSLIVIGLSGCEKKDVFRSPEEKPKGDFFDFATTKPVTVNIDYNLSRLKNYQVLFEIYGENPLETGADGSLTRKGIEPLFRGATDTQGKYSDEITLPIWADEVYICSDYPGAIPVVKSEVTGNAIRVTVPAAVSSLISSRAVTSGGKEYPDDIMVLGDWDEWGLPDYLLAERATPPADLLYGIKNVLCGWIDIRKNYPDLVQQGVRVETSIRKATKIKLVFLNSTATKKNVVGYYTYPTGNPPASVDEISQKILAFPHTSAYYGRDGVSQAGALNFGDQIQLKYWDGTKLVEEFPAGVSIGWFLIESGFEVRTGKINGKKNFRYSDPFLNTDHYQRTIALYDDQAEGDMIALGFEDAWSENGGGNFGDALFYLEMDKESVDSDKLPPVIDGEGPKDEENYTTYRGILAFEDMWPKQGDYDMNDVVVSYESKVYKHVLGNRVYKIVDCFTPYHDGALFQNAFGYQLHLVDKSEVKSVTIEGKSTSVFMNGQTMEPNQEHPTFILYDNARQAVNQGRFTVTTEFRNDIDLKRLVPPYNPFIIVQSGDGRGREVHLVNYPPTDLADLSLFGTHDDKSRLEDELYYVSDNSFPFALNLSGVSSFDCPTEGVRIDAEYPEFSGWVSSGGKQNSKWYLNKNK